MESIITKDSIEKTVVIKNGKEMVRSDKLAKMFDKQHKDILKIIRGKLSFLSGENFPLKDFFIEDKTLTSRGKEYTRYFLTRKGFDFVGLSLQGKKQTYIKFGI